MYRKIIIITLLSACLLRLLWPSDMEYKYDEKHMIELAEKGLNENKIPALGMMSGGGMINAGLSIGPFMLFRLVTNDPVGIMICVALINILAIVILLFAIKFVPSEQKRLFYLGILSYSISILPVLFSRKIWAQDVLPIFVAAIWLLYFYRKHIWSLLLIGFLGVISGQIHISGFFYLAGFTIVLLWFKKVHFKQVFWIFLGGLIGLVPAFAWIKHIVQNPSGISSLTNFLKFEYWLHTVLDPLGINVFYSLGKDSKSFAAHPGNLYLMSAVVGLIVVLFILGVIFFFKNRKRGFVVNIDSEFNFILFAFILVPGILFTLAAIPVRSHYLIMAFPFLCIVVMRIIAALPARWVWIFLAMQFFVTFGFLHFIHNSSKIDGDYGIPYSKQILKTEK